MAFRLYLSCLVPTLYAMKPLKTVYASKIKIKIISYLLIAPAIVKTAPRIACDILL